MQLEFDEPKIVQLTVGKKIVDSIKWDNVEFKTIKI